MFGVVEALGFVPLVVLDKRLALVSVVVSVVQVHAPRVKRHSDPGHGQTAVSVAIAHVLRAKDCRFPLQVSALADAVLLPVVAMRVAA